MKIVLYLCGHPLNNIQPYSNHEKKSEKSQFRGLLQNIWSIFLKIVKVIKTKGSLKKTGTVERSLRKHDYWMTSGILDGILKQTDEKTLDKLRTSEKSLDFNNNISIFSIVTNIPLMLIMGKLVVLYMEHCAIFRIFL